jgi:hypothetical protein
MGVETVDHSFIHEADEHFQGIECDIASGKIHHNMNPTKNYIFVEFKFPAISRHMPSVDYELIVNTYFHECMHQMKYIQVDNTTFHNFMNHEGPPRNQDNRSCGETREAYYSYRERTNIDVIRHNDNGTVTTHYHSNIRSLGLLRHDYYMGLLLYANWPQRDYIRRTPCMRFHPVKCSKCPEFAKLPVEGWIYDPEPYKPTIEKTFFTYIEENHRLCMGYTIDKIPSGDTCFEPIEPEYYILDMDVQYFREAIYSKRLWEGHIVKNRKECDEELYSFGGSASNYDEELLELSWSAWSGPHTPLYVSVYDPKKRETVPADIWTAMSLNNMTMLWEADIHRFNNRNSAHKYTFNSWWVHGMNSDGGWFCGVKTSETIKSATEPFGGAGEAAAGQLTQVANMFGMDEGGGGSTDSIFSQMEPLLAGYEYTDIIEPLPERENT